MTAILTSGAPQRRQRDPAARRAAMIAAAVDILTEEGSSAVTHRAVAARAKVALGTTTAYFASIDELRELALRTIAARIDDSLAQIAADLRTHGADADRLADVICSYVLCERQARASLMLAHASLSDPRIRDLSAGAARRFIAVLALHVGAARADALQLLFDGATLRSVGRGQPVQRDQIRQLVQAVLEWPDPS